MSYLVEELIAKSSLISMVAFLGIFLVAFSIINGNAFGVAKLKQLTGGIGIIDMEPGYTVDKAYNILESQGAEGRAYYLKRIIPMDFIFPLTYMLFYASALLYLQKLFHPQNTIVQYAVIVPLLAAVCDYSENLAIIRMLLNYPQRLVMTARIANFFTVSKLLFIGISVVSIIMILIVNLIIRFAAAIRTT